MPIKVEFIKKFESYNKGERAQLTGRSFIKAWRAKAIKKLPWNADITPKLKPEPKPKAAPKRAKK